ncbi:MAG TPA: ABC transporter permease, partial [Acidimicrobiales bacterium]|nr:ABC transporter permease [Acidimicrobiales bacterium]
MTAPAAPSAAPPPAVAPAAAVARPSRRSRHLPRIGWVGLVMVGVFVVLGLLGPQLARYEPRAISPDSLDGPGWDHLLGTNQLGQDLASQLLHGARVSLTVAAITAAVTLVLALVVGLASGW